MAPAAKEDVASSLAKLSLKTTELETPQRAARSRKQGSPVADSWEDEADDDDGDGAAAAAAGDDVGDNINKSDAEDTPAASPSPYAGTAAPPPTPLSPVASGRGTISGSSSSTRPPFSPSALSGPGFTIPPFDGPGPAADDHQSPGTSAAGAGPSRRPEKTDAVARRMIASALGMRAPRPTEEQRAYDRAVREKERKRREEEKERERRRQEEIAKARQAIWDD